MARQVISAAASQHLAQWLDGLMRGDLRLGDLPLPVEGFYFAGWAEGMAYALQQARDYEQRLDLAYLQAYTPKERAQEYQRRLDTHFAEQSARFFAEPEIHGPAPSSERRAA